jgi:NAD-dependent SIR2 family protein deacetylase
MKNGRWECLPVGKLAPDILFNQESAAGRDGQDYYRMLDKHGRATKLLIVAGTSLLTPGVASMTRYLAGRVRERQGLVVYINRDRLPAKWVKYIHLHLQTDIESWAADTLKFYIQVSEPPSGYLTGLT